MPAFHANHSYLFILIIALLSSTANAGERTDRSRSTPAKSTLQRLNPVTLIGEVISSVIGRVEQHESTAAVLARRTSSALGLSVPFAAGREVERVSLLLAESQVLVKLAPDLQLRCEVLTRDGRDGDLVVSGPELEFGVGVQFRFK